MIIFSIGSFANKLMGYVLLPFYTSVLTTSEYGIYDIIVTTVTLLFPIFTLLISESTVRFALDQASSKPKVFSLSLAVSTLGCVSLTLLSPLLLLSGTYRPYYLFFVVYFIVYTYYTLLTQFVKGIEETKKLAASGIIATAVTLLLNILLMVVFPLGLTGYFIAAISGSIAASLFLIIRCRLWRYLIKIEAADKPLLKQMLRYSIPIMPNALSWWISTSSDKYIITYVVGSAEMGLYSVAYKIPSLMTVFTSIFFSAWQISSVEDFGSEKSRRLYNRTYRYFFALLSIISALVIFSSRIVAKLLFSGEFYAAWKYVPLLIMAYYFHDLAAYIGSLYTASKKTKMLFISTVVGALTNIVLNIIIIPKFGGLGGAFTTLVSYFIVWLIRVFDSRKIMKIEYRHLREGLCILLLACETIIMTCAGQYAYIYTFICVAIIAILQFSTVKDLAGNILPVLFKRKGNRG